MPTCALQGWLYQKGSHCFLLIPVFSSCHGNGNAGAGAPEAREVTVLFEKDSSLHPWAQL